MEIYSDMHVHTFTVNSNETRHTQAWQYVQRDERAIYVSLSAYQHFLEAALIGTYTRFSNRFNATKALILIL